jgi:hypothetical protein
MPIKQRLKKTPPPPWNAEEDKILLERSQRGDTMAQIAARINKAFNTARTRMSVAGRLDRLRKGPAKRLNKSAPKKKPIQTTLPPRSISSAPLPPTEPAPENLILLTDFKADTCRWPYGDKAPYKFCGQKISGSRSYCAAHTIKSDGKSSKK